MADMQFTYCLANRNASEAKRLFIPYTNSVILLSIIRYLSSSCNVLKEYQWCRIVQIEEAVLNEIKDHRETRTRNIAYFTWFLIAPLPFSKVALLLRNFPVRIDLLQKLAVRPSFVTQIIFINETNFSKVSIKGENTDKTPSKLNLHRYWRMVWTDQAHQKMYMMLTIKQPTKNLCIIKEMSLFRLFRIWRICRKQKLV